MSRNRSVRHARCDGNQLFPEVRSSEPTVVYVDGDGDRRASLKSRLVAAIDGVEVIDVGTGDDALEYVSGADCVVSRYELPDTDGIALLERVRADSCDRPFVLATDDGSEQLASEATAAGVSDYVPVDGTADARDRLTARIADTLTATHRCVPTEQLGSIEASVEHAADAVLITDADGEIEYVNPAFEELTGYSRREAVGRTPRILKSGEQDESYYREMWAAILDGDVWEEEIVNETKTGDTYVAHQTIAPVTDADGTPKRFVGIQRDVTRRRTLEEQIQRSVNTLKRLYEITADDPADLHSKSQSVLEIGATHLEYPIGYFTRIEDGTQRIVAAVGDHDAIQPGAEDPLERTYCRKTIESDDPVVVTDAPEEGWADDPAFEHFGLRCYVGASVVVDGEIYGTLCFGGEEPRERLVLEAQQSTVKTLAEWLGYELERHDYEARLERQNEQLERFASVVSHDLRNPLNVAQGRLELGRETGAEEHFEAVADAHDRMQAIIEDTLVLAREGTTVEETAPVSLRSLATDCWATVETESAELTVSGERTVRADADKLRHVLENLFRNSVEHGSTSNRPQADDSVEHGGETVTVEVGPTDDGFYVADDGPGIPETERERVFDHGYSGTDGTGFGLAIVESIADAHRWEVRLTESRSGGARFEFVVDGTAEPEQSSQETPTLEEPLPE